MRTRLNIRFFLGLIGIMAAGLTLAACESSPHRQRVDAGLESEGIPIPRADPAYLQRLEKKSMLAEAADMARIVSGSQLAWSGASDTPEGLLSYADTWVAFNPLTLLMDARSGAFDQLSQGSVWAALREVGARGMYVAPVGGAGGIWAKTEGTGHSGRDVVQYDFSQAAGDEGKYRRLISGATERSSLIGSDLVPAATGLGPDFFLAARNLREYPGAYCMVEVPKELWNLLPPSEDEWQVAALSPQAVADLNAKGLLPKAMLDEMTPSGVPSGWAATGEVRGVDATSRRWVYRWHRNPHYAVLNWEDPSRAAARILSGSAVRQVGLLGQAFIGLPFEAFHGLEPASGASRRGQGLGPALSAAQSMSREVHRYGGWTWLCDEEVSLASMRSVLAADTDFVFDAAFSPAAEHALLTGDATLLRFMADEMLRLKVPAHRLVHVMPSQDGINYTLPHLIELTAVTPEADRLRHHTLQSMKAAVAGQNPVPFADDTLYTNGPGLAAMALGLQASNVPADRVKEVTKGHKLLILFKAMQPGVLMLSGQDLVGALPINWSSMRGSTSEWDVADTVRGAYALTASEDSRVVTDKGMGKTISLYGPADTQVLKEGSFLRDIGPSLRLRSQIGISKGSLVARPKVNGRGVVALVTKMPGNNGFVLTVCNFGRERADENISLNGISGISSAMGSAHPLAGQAAWSVSGTSVNMTLGPWEGRAILLGGRLSAPSQKGSTGSDSEMSAPVIPKIPASSGASEPEAPAPKKPAAKEKPAAEPEQPAAEPEQSTLPEAFQDLLDGSTPPAEDTEEAPAAPKPKDTTYTKSVTPPGENKDLLPGLGSSKKGGR